MEATILKCYLYVHKFDLSNFITLDKHPSTERNWRTGESMLSWTIYLIFWTAIHSCWISLSRIHGLWEWRWNPDN